MNYVTTSLLEVSVHMISWLVTRSTDHVVSWLMTINTIVYLEVNFDLVCTQSVS